MKAYINNHPEKGGLKIEEIEIPKPTAEEVLIKVFAAAINYRDLRMIEGNYGFKFQYGTIPGSDICGNVVEVGINVSKEWIGKPVIVNPNINWGSNLDVPSEDYSILGTPVNGGFAEYFCCNVASICNKPKHITMAEACCLPLTGTTAYRALFTKGAVNAGENVLITGASGGVSQIAIQLAVAAGAKVYVTSSKTKYIEKAIELGAENGFNYTDDNFETDILKYDSKFDFVLDAAGGKQLNKLVQIAKVNGRIVVYGALNGNTPEFDLSTFYYKQIQLKGTILGNDTEFFNMVKFVNAHKIVPIIDTIFNFTELEIALDKLKNRNHFGKLVLQF